MDVLPVPGRVTFENRGGDGDITSQLEAVPIALERERHEVRISEKLHVRLADRDLTERCLLRLGA
jgi:hypothetical protein